MKLNYLFPVFLISLFFLTSCEEEKETVEDTPAKKIKKEKILEEYGFILNDYLVVKDTVRSGDNFGAIMDKHGVGPGQVYNIVEKVKDTFNPARIIVGKPYTILKTNDSLQQARIFIYEHDKINFSVVNLQDSISSYRGNKLVTIKRKIASGVINSSLSAAIDDAGLSILMTDKLSDIYQWKIDFFKLQKGDKFKVIYNEKYINDTIYAGIDNIEAAEFNHFKEPYYAFAFRNDSITGFPQFYDEEANSLQSFFLKAPLQFTRISSRYTKRRFHPVQKRWKAHKGTDYAAPHGTPIWTTADGVVIKSSYTSGNGKYVKVRHNEKYTTQYLHMSKRNVKVGQRVKQGDIIGYVGSTGLATGPHVCYRFWVYGRQVDPYKQNLPSSEPLKESLKPDYFLHIEPLKEELDNIQ